MNQLPYHIQDCDFSVQEFEPITFREAQRKITELDWDQKLSYEQELMEQKGESCPFNFNFKSQNNSFMLFKQTDGFWLMTTLKTGESKKTGFLSWLFSSSVKQETIDAEGLSLESLLSYLRLFYEGEFQQLQDTLNQH